jgi:hypothetical protein
MRRVIQGRRLLLVVVVESECEQDVVDRRGRGRGWRSSRREVLVRADEERLAIDLIVDSTVLTATPAWHEFEVRYDNYRAFYERGAGWKRQ